ncbi:MAG: TonB-dependent receptor [Hyphomicrobium sp.]|uniref:TonB-dependent receptor n=1 Tax=Hyphomicrobium sp. TaxID=82 RepID=UPI001327067C|nr:TonB-dependent receptor [Hyphomicrobium sp.]KAB2941423.1 MAG: TonB-dependent receptor [Hyphomicrobium sp.]MBZ0212078.1 TonB-dependent receptor [Hyphomicrobium sp.]
MKVCVAFGVAAAALVVHAGPSEAQSANTASETVELPAVVVTTASPVAKPKKAKRKAPPASPPAAGEAAAAPAPMPELQPLPGTIVADQAFVPVTVATAREIEANGGATITDTLEYKPGISGTNFAPGANRPIIRGLDSYRIRTQENGIGTHDVAAISEDHAIPIDPLAAERVEVVRGPATLRYGSQAIGGVVSVENERIPTFIPRGGFSGRIVGGYSSVDDGADGAMSATAGSGGFAIHADGFKRDAHDYQSPRGTVLNTFVESEGASIGASLIGTDGFLGVSYTRFASLYGIPGEEAEEGVIPRIDLEQDKVQAKGEWRVRDNGIDAIRFWFGASDYAHDELAIHDPLVDTEFEVGSHFTNREQEARVEVQHAPLLTGLGELSGAAGIHLDNRKTRGQSFEGDSLLEPAHTQSIAAFWFEELALSSQLRVQVATRVEQTTVDGTGWSDVSNPLAPVAFAGERSFLPVSGGLGLLYALPFDVEARLNGQYVERAPDAAELFSKGMHEATGTFEIGNPFLNEEKASTIEAGLKKATGSFRFDAAAYYSRYRGFIYRQLTGVTCGTTLAECPPPVAGGEEFDQVLFQQRDATFYGAELAAQYDAGRIWDGVWGLDAQYDFVRARFADGENVPRIPPHRLGGGIYYHDASWLARVGLLHAFEQDEIGINEIPTPGYTLVNAELSYTTEVRAPDGTASLVTVGIKGENLADEEVLDHTSFKRREEVLQPGASVRAFGSVELN